MLEMSFDFYSKAETDLQKFKPHLSHSSIKTYLQNIKKVSKELFNSSKPSINYFKDYSSVLEYISGLSSKTTQKNLLIAIINILGSTNVFPLEILNKYKAELKRINSVIEDEYLDNVRSEREEKNWLSSGDIQKKINFLKSQTDGTERMKADRLQQSLVLDLYTKLPPTRNTWATVKVLKYLPGDFCISDDKKSVSGLDTQQNYIVISTKQLILCNYKTAKHYGIKILDLSDDIIHTIIKWHRCKRDVLGYKGNSLLINTTSLSPMTTNGLTLYLNKIFYPKKISSTMLRKIYLSEKYPVVTSTREARRDADFMGHSVDIARSVYAKKM